LHDILDAERRRLPISPDWLRGGMKVHIDVLKQLIQETDDRLRQTLREGDGAAPRPFVSADNPPR
jgi:hypothetical protein